MVMDVLRDGKTFHAAVSFIADTELKDTTDYGGFLFFFFGQNEADSTGSPQVQPTNQRLSGKQSPRPRQGARIINTHLKRKCKPSSYPIRRAFPLVEAISFDDVLLRILTFHRLAYTPYPTFERPLAQATVGLGGEGGVERGMDMEEVKEGYEVVKRKVDVLDLSVG